FGFVLTDAFDIPYYFSYGKLRASFAQVGKDAEPYSTGITFTSPDLYPLNGQVGYTRNQEIGSADLKPEITTSVEVGADLRFLDDRIGLDFTWYKANSEDQILTVPISNATGATRLVTNAGEIENRGIEMQLNLRPVQTEDIQWNIRINYSRNRNEVISIREGIESIFLGSLLVMQVEGPVYSLSKENHLVIFTAAVMPVIIRKVKPLKIHYMLTKMRPF